MKKFIFLVTLFVTQFIVAQNDLSKKVYLDSLFQEIPEGNHKYYRIINDYFEKKKEYSFQDFYVSGNLYMEGQSATNIYFKPIGAIKTYFENKGLKEEKVYDENSRLNKVTKFYANGAKNAEVEYVLNTEDYLLSSFLIINYWDKNGKQLVKKGEGYFEGICVDDDLIFEKGKVTKAKKEGVWEGKKAKISKKGVEFTFKEEYKEGVLIKGESIDLDTNEKFPYTQVFKMAGPKEGMQHFYGFVGKSFKIPEVDSDINGVVLLEFIIEKDGEISGIKILKDLGYGTGDEAVKTLLRYPYKWDCSIMRGIKIRTRFTLPVRLIISSE